MRIRLQHQLVVVFALAALTYLTERARPQGESSSASTGQQAVSVVLKHYTVNPLAREQQTQQPLSRDGSWAIGKTTPVSCPKTQETCLEVLYEIPAESVRCSWVVLLNGNSSDGTFLDENDDAERYMLRVVSQDEALALIDSRKSPAFPPIAIMAHVSGSVVMDVLVGESGKVQKVTVVSGPAMEQEAALEAAKGWRFKPLVIGARTIPYAVQLMFTFQSQGPGNYSVKMAP
jgi:TonB family protein